MKSKRDQEIDDNIDYLTAGSIIDDSRLLMLQKLVLTLAKKQGIETIEDKPILRWMKETREELLQKQTFWMEDISPEAAARIQTKLNQANQMADEFLRKKSGLESPGSTLDT